MLLSELQDSKKLDTFTEGIAQNVLTKLQQKQTKLNNGINTSDELFVRLKAGESVTVDYDLLIKDIEEICK